MDRRATLLLIPSLKAYESRLTFLCCFAQIGTPTY